MKYLIVLIAGIAALTYIDHLYNKDLQQSHDYNRWVIEHYCHTNGVK